MICYDGRVTSGKLPRIGSPSLGIQKVALRVARVALRIGTSIRRFAAPDSRPSFQISEVFFGVFLVATQGTFFVMTEEI
jgi:hypothetical protein